MSERATQGQQTDAIRPSFTPPARLLQRKCACGGTPGPDGECAQCRQKRLQRSRGGAATATAPNVVHETLRGPGQPLDAATRSAMEARFGHSFGDVRIHTGQRAADSAAAVQADAYTVGSHVVFAAGRYAPQTQPGVRLLAHELTHVVQQQSGLARSAAGGLTVGPAGDAFEQEAAAVSARVAAGETAGPIMGRASPAVQRVPGGGGAGTGLPDVVTRANMGAQGKAALYDAEYNRKICRLTLTMRIAFNFTGAWPSEISKTNWQKKFLNMSSSAWSHQYFLKPGAGCAEPRACNMTQARINVGAVPAGGADAPHFTMNVAWVAPADASPTSSVDHPTHTATMDSKDLDPANKGAPKPMYPGIHEFGHMLGLPHIHCDTNDPVCYGTTDAEKADIMGLGQKVSTTDYERSFADVLQQITGCTYTAVAPTSK